MNTINTSPVNVRFAPSPTGYLHVGNMRTALVNWLFARQHNGNFMLRIDDTDAQRSEAHYEDAIREDMSWLGLTWDREERQSSRADRYELAKQTLLESGRLYACYETADELDIKRKMLISRGKPPVYDRSSLSLTTEQIAAYEAEGRTPHYRFKLNDSDVVWQDLIRGEVRFTGQFASDPVLIRADGVPLFTFATCVDDGELNITHILRGEDHVSNSAVQVQIFEALGYDIPVFGHMALLTTKNAKLSKREGSASIRDLRGEGVMPLAVNSYLARIGTSDAIELADGLDALSRQFDCNKFSRSAATYEEDEMHRLNARLLHNAEFDDVKDWLYAHDVSITTAFWEKIRANIGHLSDVNTWQELINQPVTPTIDDAEYCTLAATVLPDASDWGADAWPDFIARLKDASGRKGKQLFMPIRLALSARTDGPELPVLFSLLGHNKVARRLNGETV